MVENQPNLRIEQFEPRTRLPSGHDSYPFKVFVVSVGEGKRYRIVDVLIDRKAALKVATSIRGRVATMDCTPSGMGSQRLSFQKWFVVLDEEERRRDKVFYVDRFSRRVSVYDDETEMPPMVTRRRRYSSSLPYRLEVMSPNNETAETVANQLDEAFERGDLDLDQFEYNVDYTFVKTPQGWEIDPQLLIANNVM